MQDIKYAIRALRSSPGFAAVAILSLALGIGANTAIFSLIDAVMLKYLPAQHPEELLQVSLTSQASLRGDDNLTNPLWEQLRDHQDIFSGVFACSGARPNLATGGEARNAAGLWVSGQFFETLGVRSILGRVFTPADDKRGCAANAVLSYGFWQKEYGGSAGVLDKAISLDSHPFRILGVTAPGFSGIHVGRGVDVFIPICADQILRGENSQLDERSTWWLNIIGRPKPGLSQKQVNARLNTLAPGIMAATLPQNWPADAKQDYLKRIFGTLPAANGLSYIRAEYRPALLTLMVVVGAVLLIACANVANLLLARAAMRQREIAIRMAIGAGRGRLIRQLLTESLLLALSGAALGVLFAQWGARLLVRFLSTSRNAVSLDLAMDWRVLGFTILVAVATGILFGLAPAWRGTRVEPQAAMKANARGVVDAQSKFGLGKVLVMVQVALSLVLVIGAGLMLSTFQKLTTLDAGFDRDHVLLVNVDLRNANFPPERRAQGYDDMLERLRALPGVRAASYSSMTPISGSSSNTPVKVEGYVPKSRRDSMVWVNRISPGFFATFGTPFIAGRDFEKHDVRGAPLVAIINESMARKFFGSPQAALGKSYRTDFLKLSDPIEIIGIVKDAKYRNLREENEPIAYVAQAQEPAQGLYKAFEIRAEGPAASTIPSVKAAFEQVNRDITLEFRTLATQVDESLGREKLLATLSGFFGGLALLLATIGLYGVMSYNVTRRRSEIGIRMALGAEQSRVLRMVLGEVALLIGIGLIVGLGAAFATTRFVSSFLYGLNPNDPWTLGLAAGLLAAVAVIAGYLPARRVSRLDPMTALREE